MHLGFEGEAEGSLAPMRRASPPRADVLVLAGSPTDAIRHLAGSAYRSVGLLVASGPVEEPDAWLATVRSLIDTDGVVLLPPDEPRMLGRLWNELSHEPAIDVAIHRATDGRAIAWLSDNLLAAGDLYATTVEYRTGLAS